MANLLTIVCVKNIKTDECRFFQSVESLFEHVQTIQCYTRNGEQDASVAWVNAEIAENGVASIHTTKPAYEVCGIEFPAEIDEFVVSYMEVI